MKVKLLDLFLTSIKLGAMLIGGGYVLLPLLLSEVVDKKGWVEKDEILDYFAISQCLPGLIAINAMLFIGYKLRGKTGALLAFFGLLCAPFFIILLIANLIDIFFNSSFLNSFFYGINIAIVLLMFLAFKELWENSIKDRATFLFFLFILALSILKVSPSKIIISALLGSILYNFIKIRRSA